MRSIIFHYHYFKNAGTSFDGVLQQSYPGRCTFREFDNLPKEVYQEAVSDWILGEKDAVAFSSHTANLPVPIVPGVEVIPFFFIRHPIARLRSVYEFEKKQTQASTVGSHLARNNDFSGYLKESLKISGNRQCRNFHCCRLAKGSSLVGGSELERAKQVLDYVECFGLVERFEDSLRIFYDVYKDKFQYFIPSNLRLNANFNIDLDNALWETEKIIGSDFYQQLIEENSDDLLLYEYAQLKFNNILKIRQLID